MKNLLTCIWFLFGLKILLFTSDVNNFWVNVILGMPICAWYLIVFCGGQDGNK